MAERSKFFFPVVLLLATIGFMATDIYLPSLPAMRRNLHSSEELVQLTVTVYLLGFSLSQLIYGPLSDRFGRRLLAQVGLLIGSVGALIALVAPNVPVIIAARLVQGIGMGATATLWRAILRDSYSRHDLAIYGSYIAVGTAALMALAPTLGGYLEELFGWRASFLFMLVYTLAGVFGVFRWLPETNIHLDPSASRPRVAARRYLSLIRSPLFIGYNAGGSLAMAGLMAYLTASPFLLQDIVGLSPVQYGWTAFVFAAGIALGGFLNTRLVRAFGPDRMLIMGASTMLLSGAAMLLLGLAWINVFVIVVPMFFFALGAGQTFSNSLSLALSPFPKLAGVAGALYGGLQIFWGMVASGAMAALHEETQRPLSIVLIVCSLVALLGQRWASWKRKAIGAPEPTEAPPA